MNQMITEARFNFSFFMLLKYAMIWYGHWAVRYFIIHQHQRAIVMKFFVYLSVCHSLKSVITASRINERQIVI